MSTMTKAQRREHLSYAARPFVQIRPFTEFTGEEIVRQEGEGRRRFEVSVATHNEPGNW